MMKLEEAIKGIKVQAVVKRKEKEGEVTEVIMRDCITADVLSFNEKTGMVVTMDGKKYRKQ